MFVFIVHICASKNEMETKMKTQKVALITGGNRGLGLETARQLGEKNVSIIIGARNLTKAHEAAEKLRAAGIDAYAIKLDVNVEEERQAAADFIHSSFGKLDILINNAGVVPDDFIDRPLNIEASQEELMFVFQTNFFSIVHLTRELLPLLEKSEAGRIVNLSSAVGSLTMQSMENSPLSSFRSLAYNSSKASLNMFTILLSEELKHTKIKVNSAHPGWVKTDMGTQLAPMEVSEGAKTPAELALIDSEGPSGKFIHSGSVLPW